MAKLIYASNVSLDGCTEDERGAFDWAAPDDEVFAFITDFMRSAATYLYGRHVRFDENEEPAGPRPRRGDAEPSDRRRCR